MPTDSYRGICKTTGNWVYGNFRHDKEPTILSADGAPVPIDPITLGKQMMVGDIALYHGDIVMWCKFRKTSDTPGRLEEVAYSYFGVVCQCGDEVRIAEDIYSCGPLLDEFEPMYNNTEPMHFKVVGNLFDAGIVLPDEDFYTPYVPWAEENENA